MAEVRGFEYIVVGCGGIGSGTIYWLSKSGKDVLGLEQFSLGHVRGGSQDHSRSIRHVYSEEKYTKLTQPAFDAWAEVERDSGLQLVFKCGNLTVTPKDDPSAKAAVLSCCYAMDRVGTKYELLDAPGIRRKFPQLNIGNDMMGVYQKDSGLVDAANGNAAHIQLARGNGATIIENCPVTGIKRLAADCIQVSTRKGEFRCRRLILTAGAWLNNVLGHCGIHLPITVTQEQVTYYATPHIKDFTKDNFPCFYHEGMGVYGMPIHGNTGPKLGVDGKGRVVTADTRNFTPNPAIEKQQEEFLKTIIPKFLGPKIETKTCLYAMTPDRDFVVDTIGRHGFPEVSICCGAGHAFKFASLLGKILSQIAITGRSEYDISSFTIERPAIADPNFKGSFELGKVAPPPGYKAKL